MTPLPPTLPSSSNPCLPIFFVVLGTPSSYTLHSRGFINLSALVSLLSLAPIDVLTSILSLNLSEPGISQNLAFPFSDYSKPGIFNSQHLPRKVPLTKRRCEINERIIVLNCYLTEIAVLKKEMDVFSFCFLLKIA